MTRWWLNYRFRSTWQLWRHLRWLEVVWRHLTWLVTWCNATSSSVTWCDIISRGMTWFISRDMSSPHIPSHDVTSSHVVTALLLAPEDKSYHVAWQHLTWCDATHLTCFIFTSLTPTWSDLISRGVTSPHILTHGLRHIQLCNRRSSTPNLHDSVSCSWHHAW